MKHELFRSLRTRVTLVNRSHSRARLAPCLWKVSRIMVWEVAYPRCRVWGLFESFQSSYISFRVILIELLEEQQETFQKKTFTLSIAYCTASVCFARYNIVILLVTGSTKEPTTPSFFVNRHIAIDTEKSCVSGHESKSS